ncbi:zinc-binding dehydrogenase [Amycolatopsis sp. NPDC051716]|uniref:zinc-binding dehydrogenase n=1 Tax=Amycolatopsis sp. NPDC051716 TaxID=3155804 RepID=UPI003432F63B
MINGYGGPEAARHLRQVREPRRGLARLGDGRPERLHRRSPGALLSWCRRRDRPGLEPDRTMSPDVYQISPDTDRLDSLLAQAAQGLLSTSIEYTYPLDEAADAHRRQAAGGLTGRVVLRP